MEHSRDDVHVPNPNFDPMDPHGATHADHGHHIISAGTLMVTLLALLFFTFLTVFISRAEVWIQDTFQVILPQWVNVIVAMSIAVVKASLVCAFFMGLRYDKPLNLFVLLFCLAATGQFILPTTVDLASRGMVESYRAGEATDGGTGVGLDMTGDGPMFIAGSPRINTAGEPIFEFRRNQALERLVEEVALERGHETPTEQDRLDAERRLWFEHYSHDEHEKGHAYKSRWDTNNFYAEWVVAESHHAHDETADADTVGRLPLDKVARSSANHSVRRAGLTPGLFDDHAPSHDADHSSDHAPAAEDPGSDH